jgi:3-oxoacyl-[acyl-carrier-protein] synthase-3
MLYMQGQTVFRWAVTEMARVAKEAIDAAGLTVDQLDAFIPHQANNRITDALVRALKIPDSVHVARDIVTSGNTSAASIPLALSRIKAEESVPSGGIALIIGFGAGLAYAAQVVTLP